MRCCCTCKEEDEKLILIEPVSTLDYSAPALEQDTADLAHVDKNDAKPDSTVDLDYRTIATLDLDYKNFCVVADEEQYEDTMPIVRQISNASVVKKPMPSSRSGSKKLIPSMSLLLNTAIEEGRYVSAYRELLRLETQGFNPYEDVDRASIDRVRRLGERFVEAERLIKMKPSDFKINEKNEMLGIEWGVKLEGSYMVIVIIWESDVDFLKTVVLDTEVGLEDYISEDSIQAKELGERHAHESSWHYKRISKSVGSKQDEIIIAAVIDALDEPFGAIWGVKYSINEGDTILPSGAPVPKVEAGHMRSPYFIKCSNMIPIRRPGGGFGVRKILASEIKLPTMLVKILAMFPGFVVKKMIRSNVECEITSATDFIKTSKELDICIEQEPRSNFYSHLKRRLDAM